MLTVLTQTSAVVSINFLEVMDIRRARASRSPKLSFLPILGYFAERRGRKPYMRGHGIAGICTRDTDFNQIPFSE
jgi:hypothetical protein